MAVNIHETAVYHANVLTFSSGTHQLLTEVFNLHLSIAEWASCSLDKGKPIQSTSIASRSLESICH